MSRDSTVLPLGITENGELILVTSFFDHGDGLKGVTGATLVPICQQYIDEQREPDAIAERGFDVLWRDAVAAENTELGLADYMTELLEQEDENSDGLFPGHDNSYAYDFDTELYLKEYFPNCVAFECIGGGRMFDADCLARLTTVFDTALLARVMAQESISLERV